MTYNHGKNVKHLKGKRADDSEKEEDDSENRVAAAKLAFVCGHPNSSHVCCLVAIRGIAEGALTGSSCGVTILRHILDVVLQTVMYGILFC